MLAPHGPGSIKEQAMNDEIKKPEEVTDVPLSKSELDKVAGGVVKHVDVSSPKVLLNTCNGSHDYPPAK